MSRASGRKRGAPSPSRQLAGRYDGEGAIATCRGRVAISATAGLRGRVALVATENGIGATDARERVPPVSAENGRVEV